MEGYRAKWRSCCVEQWQGVCLLSAVVCTPASTCHIAVRVLGLQMCAIASGVFVGRCGLMSLMDYFMDERTETQRQLQH